MKYLLLTVLCFIATGCIQDLNRYQPDHISITPSVEWEIQRGSNTKTKPKIQAGIDWNL